MGTGSAESRLGAHYYIIIIKKIPKMRKIVQKSFLTTKSNDTFGIPFIILQESASSLGSFVSHSLDCILLKIGHSRRLFGGLMPSTVLHSLSDVSVEYLIHHVILAAGATIPPMRHTQKIVEN
jgi:hypothetical protein